MVAGFPYLLFSLFRFRSCGPVCKLPPLVSLEEALDLWKASFTGTDDIKPAADH